MWGLGLGGKKGGTGREAGEVTKDNRIVIMRIQCEMQGRTREEKKRRGETLDREMMETCQKCEK